MSESSKRRRAISDPAAAAQVSESDVDQAVSQWKRDVPPAYRDLLDATPVNPRPDDAI